MSFENQIVKMETSLRQTMLKLEEAPVKLCVLVDDAGELVRTIVDGDLRRALLSKIDIDSPVSELPGQSVVTLELNADQNSVRRKFLAHPDISAIVLVDNENKPVDLVTRQNSFKKILLSPPHIGESETAYVQRAFDDNWIAPAGPNLSAFEASLKASTCRAHALALSSGTAALHLALRVLNIQSGDRVYVSDLTFAASVQPIFYQNAQAVLIDSDPNDWNMSPKALQRRLEKDHLAGILPKAIIIVHLYGQSANLNPLIELAEKYGIPVIEDAAESLGASYCGRPSGSHGILSAYSFNGNKIITTSGGGALVSDRPDLIDRARQLATQGRDPYEHYQHSQIAYNYRMSNVLAGIGQGQLEHLSQRVARRREIFDNYKIELEDIPGISFQDDVDGGVGNRWLTVIQFDPNLIPAHPYQLLREFRNKGIESRPAWKPMHMQPICAECDFEPHNEQDVVSARIFLQSLCLPSGTMLTDEQQNQIISTIREFIKG